MKTVAVIPNTVKDPGYKYTRIVLEILAGRAEILMDNAHSALSPLAACVTQEQMFERADIAVILGGDGTILTVAGEISRHDIPVLGINIGHFGFLAEVEPNAIEACLDRLLSGDYRIEDRMMLQANIRRDNTPLAAFHALNDVVVARASFSRLLNLKTMVDGHILDSFVSDGVILSTPTGSTAYSLSAGGPILDPALGAILITPICPHTMHTRSVVLPSDKEIVVEIGAYGGHDSFVTVDGKKGISVKEGDLVTVTRSPYTTKLIKISDTTFYNTIRRKLNERDGKSCS